MQSVGQPKGGSKEVVNAVIIRISTKGLAFSENNIICIVPFCLYHNCIQFINSLQSAFSLLLCKKFFNCSRAGWLFFWLDFFGYFFYQEKNVTGVWGKAPHLNQITYEYSKVIMDLWKIDSLYFKNKYLLFLFHNYFKWSVKMAGKGLGPGKITYFKTDYLKL